MGQRTRTTAFAVAVVVVAVCTITSCGWFGDEPAEEPALGRIDREPIGSGPLVVVLGDSLTVQTRDALVDDMSDRSLLIAGISGEGWTGGVFSRDNPGDPPIVAAGLEYAALDPAVAVLALGTNDAWSGDLPAASSVAQIDRVVGALDGSCIVAVEIDEDVPEQPDFDGAVARSINEHLRSVADQVVAWNWTANGGTDLIVADGIHLTEKGRQVRADLITEAVDRCLAG
ncbi:MAG: SGNH/GDSL hydrolase family protein [Actinobacteria bacterium]|nr:SGNH/GDSL hydrolase family protein [Actinomycetota bacterium]